MPIPTYEDLMLPLLKEYASSGQPLSIKQLLPVMAQSLNLSKEDLAERLPSGRQGLFHNRLHWAKTYMARAGLIDSPSRGLAQITERGRALLRENPDRIDGTTLAQFPEFADWKTASATSGGDDEGGAPAAAARSVEKPEDTQLTPEERIEAARKALEKGLRAELLERV